LTDYLGKISLNADPFPLTWVVSVQMIMQWKCSIAENTVWTKANARNCAKE
jgi:hypothetical protein